MNNFIHQFSCNLDDSQKSQDTLTLASKIIESSCLYTHEPDFLVDTDGDLSVNLRTHDNQRLIATLSVCGAFDFGVYSDTDPNKHVEEIKYFENATLEDLIRIIKP